MDSDQIEANEASTMSHTSAGHILERKLQSSVVEANRQDEVQIEETDTQ